jgi:hypothetical protein
MRTLLTAAVGGNLPPVVRGIVTGLLDTVTAHLADYTDVTAETAVALTYHTIPEPKPTPTPAPSGPGPSRPDLHIARTCPHLGAFGLQYEGSMHADGSLRCAYINSDECIHQVAIGIQPVRGDEPGLHPIDIPGIGRAYYDTVDGCDTGQPWTALYVPLKDISFGIDAKDLDLEIAIARYMVGLR